MLTCNINYCVISFSNVRKNLVMSAKNSLTDEEKALFLQSVGKIKTIVQDKVVLKKSTPNKKLTNTKDTKKQSAEFNFSDEFEPLLNQQGPLKFVREDVSSFEVKNLRRGQYQPDLILDLHGLTQQQAKQELSSLLYACQKEHAQCLCIVHGIGNKVLKRKVPHWLVQHPDVMAFHQAPLEWGGNGAVLVLMELKDKYKR